MQPPVNIDLLKSLESAEDPNLPIVWEWSHVFRHKLEYAQKDISDILNKWAVLTHPNIGKILVR